MNYKAEHVTVRSEARDIKKVRAWQGTRTTDRAGRARAPTRSK